MNAQEQSIETSAGKLEYDYLVVATGAEINYFGNKDIAKNAFPLKQVTHALDLRSHIFQQFENTNKGVMATVGRNKAIADLPGNIYISGFIGWVLWMIVHLLFLVVFRNKAIVFANWIWNYFTFGRGIRLIFRPSTKTHDQISREMEMEMNETENFSRSCSTVCGS